MSKRKRVRTAKAQVSSKVRPKAAHSGEHTRRASSKQARVLGLLRRPVGATIATIMTSTGWQPHTVRGFFAAVVRKKLALRLEAEKTDGERVYRIVRDSALQRANFSLELGVGKHHLRKRDGVGPDLRCLRKIDIVRIHARLLPSPTLGECRGQG